MYESFVLAIMMFLAHCLPFRQASRQVQSYGIYLPMLIRYKQRKIISITVAMMRYGLLDR